MRSSFIILACFISGVLLSWYRLMPEAVLQVDWSLLILPVMMFSVGMSIGFDLKSLYAPLRMYKLKIVLVPLATIVGTLLACLLLSLFQKSVPMRETMAIGAGFGYYSFSAVYLKELAGPEIGTMALVSNLFREIFTLLATPLLVLFLGRLAPIAAAGATAVDTSLPVIARYSGQDFVVISLFCGVIVDISVPVLITLLYL